MYSCGSFKEAGNVLRNEKTKTTDEFLVKKKILYYYPLITKKFPSQVRYLEKKKMMRKKLKKF